MMFEVNGNTWGSLRHINNRLSVRSDMYNCPRSTGQSLAFDVGGVRRSPKMCHVDPGLDPGPTQSAGGT